VPLKDGRLALQIDADRGTCLILICQAAAEKRWADHLTQAMLRPQRIQGY